MVYSGGTTDHPTYQDMGTDGNGHAEVALVDVDPGAGTCEQVCEAFVSLHDPTQLDRQGPDVGDQYRSAVFTFDEAQLQTARAVRDRLAASGRFRDPIVTQIAPAATFWRAEDYHQRYIEKHGGH